MSKHVPLKEYRQDQPLLLPPSLDELVPQNHLARLVNQIIDKIDYQTFLNCYKPGGTSTYDPKMLSKVIIYSYLSGIYSGRKMAKLLHENVIYMWLSGNNKPNFRTINRFRSERFSEILKNIFVEVLEYCHEAGLIKLDTYYVDGTKLEANSNKYKITWKKNVERYSLANQDKIQDLLDHIDEIIKSEKDDDNDDDNEGTSNQLNSDELTNRINEIAERINQLPDKNTQNEAKKTLTKLKKRIEPTKRYEHQEDLLNGRNSFCKTDPDAIGIRMKDDSIKPAYNVMIGTENQVVLSYDVHDKASDTDCFIDHIENARKHLFKPNINIVGDAGFGSEENYNYLYKNMLNNYLKFNTFHLEKKKSFQNDRSRKENFSYDAGKDEYICLENGRFTFYEKKIKLTKRGFPQELMIYKCTDCKNCCNPCTESECRQIQINKKLEIYKTQARTNLNSDFGIKLRKQRGVDVETVFGNLKHNYGFRRFHLRGMKKVNIDIGLAFLGHNIRKLASHILRLNGKYSIFFKYFVNGVFKLKFLLFKRKLLVYG